MCMHPTYKSCISDLKKCASDLQKVYIRPQKTCATGTAIDLTIMKRSAVPAWSD